jgi:hypothetical protein
MPSTWDYAREHAVPLLDRAGLVLHIADHELATVDLYGHNGDLLLPVYTSTGKLPAFCSGEWKASVVSRYARRVLGLKGKLVNWIGFSLDEARRVKSHDAKRYPLLELCLTREDCLALIADAGLPPPPKSRCFMCPHQTNAQWREVRASTEMWADAVRIDEETREANDQGRIYLHQQRVPLADVNLDIDDRKEPSRQCGFGLCFV